MRSCALPLVLAVFLMAVLPTPAVAGLFDDAVSGSLDSDAPPVQGEGSDTPPDASPPGETAARVESQPAEKTDESTFGFELNGFVRADVFLGKVYGQDDAEVKNGYGEAALKLTVRKRPHAMAYADGRLRYGYEDGGQELHLELKEAWVDLYLGPFDIRMGQQIIVWGRADSVNPTSNLVALNATVRSDDLDDKRMGNLGLKVSGNWQPVRLEAVWMPLYRANTLPRLPFPDTDTLAVTLKDAFPSASLRNSLGAARLHVELPAVEFSFSYLFGYSPTPGIVLDDIDFGQERTVINLTRRAYRHHVAGFDFSLPVKDWFGLRGEAAYKHPFEDTRQPAVARPDLQWVLGLDRQWGEFYLIGQYVGRYVWQWEAETGGTLLDQAGVAPTPPLPEAVQALMEASVTSAAARTTQLIFGQAARWQHSAWLRMEYKLLQETLTLEATGSVNFTTWEWMVRPRIAYNVADAVTLAFGGEVFMGPDDSFNGLIDQMVSAGYMEVKVSF